MCRVLFVNAQTSKGENVCVRWDIYCEKFPYMESAVGVGGHETPYLPALEKIVPVSEGLGGKRNTFDEVIMRERVEKN